MSRRSYFLVGIMAIVAVLIIVTDNQKDLYESPISQTGGKESMDIKELEEKILAQDWEALDMVDLAADKTDALALLERLSKHADAGTREIAYNCAALVPGKEALRLLVGALSDENDDIRVFALQSLQVTDNEPILDSFRVNLDNDDAVVRGGVALLIGRSDQQAMTTSLEKRLEIEQDESVQRAIKLALARLGEKTQKDFFADQMEIPDSRVRMRALEDFRYIGAPDLLVRILPALEDFGPGHLITDKSQPVPQYARVCDAAVNVVADLSGYKFSFEIDEFKIYSDEELAEAKSYLRSLKAE